MRPAAHTPGHNPRPAPRNCSGSAVDDEKLETHPDYLDGWKLFQAGYPWEAHEAWEDTWRALPGISPGKLLIKALIRLAAAAVKARQRNRAGLEHHLEGTLGQLRCLGDASVAGIAPRALARWIADIDREEWLRAGPDEPGPLVGIGPR